MKDRDEKLRELIARSFVEINMEQLREIMAEVLLEYLKKDYEIGAIVKAIIDPVARQFARDALLQPDNTEALKIRIDQEVKKRVASVTISDWR